MRRRVIAAWVLFACTIGLAVVWVAGVASGTQDGELQFLLPTLGGSLLGLLLVRRQPENRIGLVFLAASLAGVVSDASGVVVAWAIERDLDGLAVLMTNVGEAGWGVLWLTSFVVLPLLFPTGRLVSGRWAWVLWVGGLSMLLAVTGLLFVEQTCLLYGAGEDNCLRQVSNPIAIAGFDAETPDLLLLPAFVMPFPAVASMIVRYRRSGAVERLQLKWVLLACIVLAVTLLVSYIGLPDGVDDWLFAIALSGLPLSAFVAITRYRLYEIDRIVTRTLAYAMVVGLLAGVFFGVVTLVSSFLPTESSDLAIAGSTLAVAALFNPLRSRVQKVVDRRFNRSHYDAERVIQGFAGSLQGRAGSDGIVEGWVGVVSETMQPSMVAIWVREGK